MKSKRGHKLSILRSRESLASQLPIIAPKMYLPPEIILSIVDYLDRTPDNPKSDRATLIALRSVNKEFCSIVTPVLFRDFSLHYGVSRSVPQMEGVTSSTVRRHIRSLFIPSECFFPLGKDVQFNSSDHYPWSRGPALDWLAVQDYSQSPPVRKGVRGRPSHAKQTLMFHYPFREFPTKPWQPFSLRLKEFREQEDAFSTALSSFIEACENLQEVHVAMGLGAETERMSVFGQILGKQLMPRIVAKEIRGLKISAPSPPKISLPFDGYAKSAQERFGEVPGFSSLESLTIQPCYGSTVESENQDFKILLDAMTGLKSFSLIMSKPLRRQSTRGIPRYPTSANCPNLTSVRISSIFLGYNEAYLHDFISSVPTITDLTLERIALPISNRLPESHDLLPRNWKALFQHILSSLPELTAYKFEHLAYGAIPEPMWWGRGNKEVHLLLPETVDKKELTPHSWNRALKGSELLSPFSEDFTGLQLFRKAIKSRRAERDLRKEAYADYAPVPPWAERRNGWVYLADS
ncbi:hypothetical protein TWF481_006182 [Arthrobotrys musiformis]|uniref:F-box domain-containing protein n=1 Tax=Arthrobotrys musiformis TaxID=47236 RepID=A0AAV9WHY8_9PEZI